MSPAASAKKTGGPYRKPRADVYTVLLIIAMIALLVGILCLWAEMDAYEWKLKGGPRVSVGRASDVQAPGVVGFSTPVTTLCSCSGVDRPNPNC